jgi:hypothetical protein
MSGAVLPTVAITSLLLLQLGYHFSAVIVTVPAGEKQSQALFPYQKLPLLRFRSQNKRPTGCGLPWPWGRDRPTLIWSSFAL